MEKRGTIRLSQLCSEKNGLNKKEETNTTTNLVFSTANNVLSVPEKLGLHIDFRDGESINFYEGPNTSCKWNMKQLLRLAERSGFAVDALWTNDEDNYCVICLAPAGVSEF